MLNYIWKHLIDTEPRGEITYSLLKKHIKDEYEYILDGLCGFAPMRAYFNKHKYYGFDINKDVIETLKNKYKDSNWQVCDDAVYEYPEKQIDVYLLFGISAGENKTDSKTETLSAIKTINEFKPTLVVLEMCIGHYDNIKNAKMSHNFDKICDFCNKFYKIAGDYVFDANLIRKEVSKRRMLVYEKT